MLTKMRSTPIGGLLALDFSIDFHKALGITTAILSCIHTLAHLIHICKLSINIFRGSKKIELQLNVKSSTSRWKWLTYFQILKEKGVWII